MNKLPVEMIDALFSTMTTLDKANFCRINKDFYGYCKQRNYIAPSWKVLKKNLKWVEKPGKVFGNNGRWVKFNLLKMDPSWKKSRKRVALLRHVPEEGIKFYYDADGRRKQKALGHADKRKALYPSNDAQLDMQYWDAVNGTSTWVDAIAAIKVKHPKP